jgi:RNA polymerase sigma-70 factor (sigma-E family)
VVDDFDGFVRASAPSLAKFAYLLCGNQHTAEDLVQGALFHAHRSWDRVSKVEHRTAYVRRIVVREYLSWQRRKSANELPLASGDLADHQSQYVPDPLHDMAETDAMWRSLQRLTRKQRTALVLRFYVDLPDHEIATHMGCSEGTVRSHVSRGLQSLRTLTPPPKEESQP